MNKPVVSPLPRAFKHIRLELARSKEFPQGSPTHGYEFAAPIDADGHIDAALWHKHRDHCRVRRFWGDEEEIGLLVHKPGGPEHARWVFEYGAKTHDDEQGYRFAAHRFRPGEYVSITDPTGTHTLAVISVEPIR